jgi:esterase/lipase
VFRFEFKVLLLRFFIASSIIVQLGCAQNNIPKHAVYQKSPSQLPIEFKSFEAYQLAAKNWISGNRVFLTHNKIQEIKFNTPFELQAKLKAENEKSKGILLVHGLGDSPYYFSDIAQALSKQGFLVRVLLLPGHGSRPADLLSISSDAWVRLVDIQINALKAQVDEVYLGGFSTGANLVTSAALTDNAIKGLILFSPAFKAKTKLASLSPLLPLYKPWPWLKSPNHMKNIARYSPVPSNAFAQYYYTSREVQDQLQKQVFSKPIFMVLSEADSVVDVLAVAHYFNQNFTHKNSRLVWFGNKPKLDDDRIIAYSAKSSEYQVSNYSHMGILFKPENAYFGYPSGYRICDNGQTDAAFSKCYKKGDVWYSAWGYKEPDKAHARLTFNPKFDDMMQVLKQVLKSK